MFVTHVCQYTHDFFSSISDPRLVESMNVEHLPQKSKVMLLWEERVCIRRVSTAASAFHPEKLPRGLWCTELGPSHRGPWPESEFLTCRSPGVTSTAQGQ